MLKSTYKDLNIFDRVLFLLVLGLSFVRLFVAAQLPVWGIVPAAYDDALMVQDAWNLSNGAWLGPYNEIILTKGIVYPLALCIARWSGISIHVLVMASWIIASVLFVIAVNPLMKKVRYSLILLMILLLNPAFSNTYIFLRVYRNSITMSEIMLIFSGAFGIYLRYRHEIKKTFFWVIVLSVGYVALVLSREDSVWILPFLIVFTIVTVILAVKHYRSVKKVLIMGLCLSIPFVSVYSCKSLLSLKNERAYGKYLVNELSDGAFSKAMKTVYLAGPKENLPWDVTVSREKLEILFENSESLKDLEDEFEIIWSNWDIADRHPGDNEIEDGWFFWAFRDAAAKGGYFTDALSAERFFDRVDSELNTAIEQGDIETGYYTPYALLAPLRKEYIQALPATMIQMIIMVYGYRNLDIDAAESVLGSSEMNRCFEEMTSCKLYSSTLRDETEMASFNNAYECMNVFSLPFRILAVPIFVISLFGLGVIIIRNIQCLKRKEKHPFWGRRSLIIVSVILSQLVFLAGVSYNEIASCETLTAGYLPAGYLMALITEGLAVIWGAEAFRELKTGSNNQGQQL